MHLVGFILRGVTASSRARATGKYDREKVWPEQEEAHERRGHWLEKAVEDLEESEERAHSHTGSPMQDCDKRPLRCWSVSHLPSFHHACVRPHVAGAQGERETTSGEGYLCSLFCYCFFPRHLSPFGLCTGALNPLCGALILQNFVTVY